MEVVVLGAGSLGSLVGGLLARRHRVTLVGRDPHVTAIEEDGLRVSGGVEAHVDPAATTDGQGLSADLAVVTVKSFDVPGAAEDLATGRYDAVLSLTNGMGSEATLSDRLAPPVLAGTATYGAQLVRPGEVRCTGVGEVALGPRTGGESPEADRVGRAFREAGIETVVADDMPRRLWEKLAVNAGINPVTALARVENGALRAGEAARLAREAARETARVARGEGVDLPDDRAVDAVESVAAATADNRSSMLQDVESGQRTEIDAISGQVVDRGETHGVAVPVNRTLMTLVRTWERGQGIR